MPRPDSWAMRPLTSWLIAAPLVLIAGPSGADDERPAQRVPLLPKYQQECSACHVAFPPGLLPASSWQRLMNNLSHHFGTDASLDAAAVNEIAAWLKAHAGTQVREPPPGDRITRSGWFVRQHSEVRAAAWNLPAVKSAANCVACHTQAGQGDFSERNIRVPH